MPDSLFSVYVPREPREIRTVPNPSALAAHRRYARRMHAGTTPPPNREYAKVIYLLGLKPSEGIPHTACIVFTCSECLHLFGKSVRFWGHPCLCGVCDAPVSKREKKRSDFTSLIPALSLTLMGGSAFDLVLASWAG